MRHILEVALFTPDVSRMVKFYRQVLAQNPSGAEGAESAWFSVGEVKWFIHQTYSGYELPPFNHIAFGAADLDGECAELRRAGLQIDHGPKRWDWGNSAYLRDPDGNWVELHETQD